MIESRALNARLLYVIQVTVGAALIQNDIDRHHRARV
jgi:hypothetical protein